MLSQLVAVLLMLVAPQTATPSPVPTTTAVSSATDRAIDALALTLTPADIALAIGGVYRIPGGSWGSRVKMVGKTAAEMPPDDPIGHIVGPDASGNFELWVDRQKQLQAIHDKVLPKGFMESQTATMILMSAPQGGAGPQWQKRFAESSNQPLLARAIARSYTKMNDDAVAKSHADIAWVHQNVTIGMTRTQVYASLKGRGLVARNPEYNPGTPFGSGCSWQTNRESEEWPQPGQPLPKPGCKIGRGTANVDTHHPYVQVTYFVGNNFACGSEATQTFTFDTQERLQKLDDHESRTCL